eukprot:442536-Pyramimonas_sp.AAC.1
MNSHPDPLILSHCIFRVAHTHTHHSYSQRITLIAMQQAWHLNIPRRSRRRGDICPLVPRWRRCRRRIGC